MQTKQKQIESISELLRLEESFTFNRCLSFVPSPYHHLALPKPPTSLVLSEVTATSVKLAWNSGNVEPVESYVIQYKPKYLPGSEYTEIDEIRQTQYSVVGLNAYTVYEFRVIAVNNIGRGTPSNPVDITTGEMG